MKYCEHRTEIQCSVNPHIEVHGCKIHGTCTPNANSSLFKSCINCPDRIGPDAAPLRSKSTKIMENHKDPLIVHGKDAEQTHVLRDLISGCSAFLVAGGPSSKQQDLKKLQQRGVFTLAVNNVAGHFKPNAFVCSDPPSKFHHGIWLDPTIMKFIPSPKMRKNRGHLRRKRGDVFEDLTLNGKTISTKDCPNLWGFARSAWWAYGDEFFTESHATWGNNKGGMIRTGNPTTVCTLLLGIRLLYYLGVRNLYLVGVDFTMSTSQGYSFEQGRTEEAATNNNSQYRLVNHGLCQMAENEVFDKFGLRVFNTFETSGLRAFPYVPFEVAVQETLKEFPKEPFDLSGWYEKK